MQSRDLSKEGFLAILIFGEPPGLVVKRSLKEGLNLEGVILLSKRQDDSFALLIADHQRNGLIIGQHSLYL